MPLALGGPHRLLGPPQRRLRRGDLAVGLSPALGQPTPGGQLLSKQPVPGDNLKLSIESNVQEAGEAALVMGSPPMR